MSQLVEPSHDLAASGQDPRGETEYRDNPKDLLGSERRNRILELLQEEGSARVRELSLLFAVSEPTIRQDLEKLDEQGVVTREHGGAFLRTVAQQVNTLSLQRTDHPAEKEAIARLAAGFVAPSDRIILDSGSTLTALARCLCGVAPLTVITNALNIALIMGANPKCQLMVTGGEFKAPTLSLTGDKAALFFQNLFVDKLFLATGGISPTFELTYPGINDIPVKQAMIRVARETYLLADSSKFGKISFASLGSMRGIQGLITDDGIDRETVDRITDLGVRVYLARSSNTFV